jgi:Cys-tRNA synthase (O-phospho-L-seryl-tRNA:Cys-tRNA synthase)
MNVKTGQDTILVRFKDYSFFVPKEGLEKKKVVMRGVAKMDTISVEMLRHYAEDAKLSIEEINKINEPDYSISFLADGVIIKK